MASLLWKQISRDPITNGGSFVDIEGLNLQLPPSTTAANAALITLNLSQPYADGGSSNGIAYQIDVNGSSVIIGSWANGTSQNGRSPFTMITLVKLTANQQFVQAQWAGVRGTTAHLGSSASLSALLVQV
jgi:hypothetical protein